MTLRAVWRQVIESGVEPGMSARAARHVELTNLAALIAGLAIVFFTPLVVLTESPAVVGVTIVQLVPVALALALNRRRRHHAATVAVAVGALLAWIGQPLLYGAGAGHHIFLLVHAAAVPLLFSRDHPRTVAFFLAASFVAFVCLQTFGEAIEPTLVLNDDARLARYAELAAGAFLLIGGIGLYAQHKTAHAEDEAAREHAKSEALLRAILPSTIASRLKERPGEAIAERVDDVTVLFADMVGFTDACTSVPPDVVVERLNAIFRAFDELAAELGLEKIKTIGDAYMAAAGVPVPVDDHVERAATMAVRMLERAKTLVGIDGKPVRLRIGLHTGPVVVGVIGREKPAYDLWGDTVNTASRMESSGVPGRVQLTPAVRAKLSSRFKSERRGVVEVKGKGPIEAELLVVDDEHALRA